MLWPRSDTHHSVHSSLARTNPKALSNLKGEAVYVSIIVMQ